MKSLMLMSCVVRMSLLYLPTQYYIGTSCRYVSLYISRIFVYSCQTRCDLNSFHKLHNPIFPQGKTFFIKRSLHGNYLQVCRETEKAVYISTFQFSFAVSYLVSRKLSPILHIIKHPGGNQPPGGRWGLNDGERSAPPSIASGALVSSKIFPQSLFSAQTYIIRLLRLCACVKCVRVWMYVYVSVWVCVWGGVSPVISFLASPGCFCQISIIQRWRPRRHGAKIDIAVQCVGFENS